jgi:4-hydroxybenzoyl-CoA reductase subunit beta
MNARMPEFEYIRPETVEQVCLLLSQRPGAAVLAGGTDLLVNLKHGIIKPPILIDLRKITGLDFIEFAAEGVSIGPLTTLKKLFTHSGIVAKLPALAAAASVVGSYHHQVMGTLGGNICQKTRCSFLNQSAAWRMARPACLKTGGTICHVIPGSDRCYACYHGELAPVLIALGARANLTGVDGPRQVLIEDLFTRDGQNPIDLSGDEIITGIDIPADAMSGESLYLKSAVRGSIDFPVIGLALWYSPAGKRYRICYTGVGTRPVRAGRVERLLEGHDLLGGLVDEACEIATEEAEPVKNTSCPPSVKRDLMKRMLRRALNQVLGES